MAVDKSFLGTGWSFPPEFNKSERDVKLVTEEEDIRESLHILLSTTPGERIMQPTYGCGIKSMVFEQITGSFITVIKDTIEKAVLFFEPRVILETVDVDATREFEGILEIVLHYIVRTTNRRDNIVYPFYFIEGTNIDRVLYAGG